MELVNSELKHDAEFLTDLNTRSFLLNTNERFNFLNPGQRQDRLLFVSEGVIRSYTVRDDDDQTDWFFSPGDIAFSDTSLFYNQPSDVYLEAACPTLAIQLSVDDFHFLAMKYPLFKELVDQLLSNFHHRKRIHYCDVRFRNAAERYRLFADGHAYANLRVKVKHVASFLGVNPDNLSRIRKNLSNSI